MIVKNNALFLRSGHDRRRRRASPPTIPAGMRGSQIAPGGLRQRRMDLRTTDIQQKRMSHLKRQRSMESESDNSYEESVEVRACKFLSWYFYPKASAANFDALSNIINTTSHTTRFARRSVRMARTRMVWRIKMLATHRCFPKF